MFRFMRRYPFWSLLIYLAGFAGLAFLANAYLSELPKVVAVILFIAFSSFMLACFFTIGRAIIKEFL